jgi:radical SAM protein with 4Fe4S-binding SPASM domain
MPLGLPFRLPLGLRVGELALKTFRALLTCSSVLTRSVMQARLSEATRGRLKEAESYWRSASPWLLVREEDAILIAPPNRVYKLGGSALPLLRWLAGGGSLEGLPGPGRRGFLGRGGSLDEARALEVLRFFDEFAAACEGRVPEGGFGRVGYGFDFTRLPILGEIALTYRCNERCRFCYAACGDAASGDQACGMGPAGRDSSGATGHDSSGATSRDGSGATGRDGSGATGRVGSGATGRVGSGATGRVGRGPSGRDAASDLADASTTELSTAEWKRVIDILKRDAQIPFFSFTGGEPLLRPDLEELARHARGLGLRVNLITNGSLATPARAASLKAAGIDTAQVSLESPDAATHDALCGIKGAWGRTVAGIRALREAGVSVQTNTTLTRANAPTLALLPAFLAGLGVSRFSMNLFIPAGRGLGSDDLFVPYSEVGGHVDALRREAHRAGLTFFWYSPTPYCLYNPVARGLGNKSCAAMDGLVHVNPSGEVLPCSSWPEPLGKLLEKPFREVWFSERAALFKNKRFAPESCAGCGSFVACQGACPLYWRYAGENELERAKPKETATVAETVPEAVAETV